MVISSVHTRLTRTSSDLRSLSATLLPPSPILKAGDFMVSLTSGEIPILLEVMAHVYGSPAPAELPGLCDVSEESMWVDATKNTRDQTRKGKESPKNWMCEEPNNMHLTAEPLNDRDRDAGSPGNSESDSSGTRAISGGPRNGTHVAHNDLFGAGVERSDIPGDCSPPIFEQQDNVQEPRDSQTSCPNTMEPSSTTVAPEEDLGGDQLVTFATFHTYSTLPTPTFAPPSPSSSADVASLLSSPNSRQRHRRPLERARAVRFPGRPRSPRMQQIDDLESDRVRSASPSPTNHASYARRPLIDSAPMASAHVTDSHPNAIHPFMKYIALPEELSWLRQMTIELWIDQEGFRAVRPCMQLVGYSPRSRSLHPYESAENLNVGGSDPTAGVAEFMPTKREAFTFHYATLDSPPTLRTVSVAGDETRDYIARQATLSVKVNGVYTVLGTETLLAPTTNNDAHGTRLQSVRLRWKFDYLVSDRKVDGTGKMIPGEKTLTPLTFSCSPHLFHPLQGKKTGLMYIMKKNLAPKLASLKLVPPTYAPSHGMLSPASYRPPIGRDAVTHVRSHSDAISATSGRYPLARTPLDAGVRGGTTQKNHIPRARRRRASSAGENSLTCLRNGLGHGGMVTLKEGMLVPGLTSF